MSQSVSTRGRHWLIAIVLLVLIGNAGFYWFFGRTNNQVLQARPEQSHEFTLVVLLDDQRALAATLSNQVLLLAQGQVVHQLQLPTLIGGLATAPDQKTFYVGTSDGKITVLNDSLQAQQELKVNGRVVGLQAAPQGGFIVAHGIGAFSDRYYVSAFPPGAAKAAFTTRVEFTITALDVSANNSAVYGTANARVGLIDAQGKQGWRTTLKQTPDSLLNLPDGRVLVGDDKGNLTLLAAGGQSQWTVKLTEYPVRSLAFDATTQLFLAGDGHGELFVVDNAGALRLTQTVAQSDLIALLPLRAGEFVVAPRVGPWLTLQTNAIHAAGLAGRARLVWLGLNAMLLLGLVAAAVMAVAPWRAFTVRQSRRIWRQRMAYLFVLPSLALILVFSYYPAGMALYQSFTNFSTHGITEFIGLGNYQKILTEDFYFRVGFLNMTLMVIANIVKTFTMPLLVAELIFSLRSAVHRYLFRTLFVLPAVVPGLITVFLWRMVYDPYVGMLNQLLAALGLTGWQHAWLGEEKTALASIIAAGFPYIGAFPFLIFFGGLLNINADLYDAAKIDGATWWTRFWFVDLPLLMPQFRLLLFFAFAGAIQGFAQVYIFTRGGPGYATYVPGLQMYFKIGDGDFGYASAIGVILFVLIFLGTLFILRFRRQTFEAQ